MANYADYATKIDAEISEAAEATEQRKGEVPAQFAGKSVEEVARSYEELRKLQERQANELGELRRTATELTDQLVRSSQHTAENLEPTKPITIDDLYENPEAVIDRRVDEKVSRKLEDFENWRRQQDARQALSELERSHPDFRDKAKSPEMRNWIAESGYRQRLALAADSGDLQAAADLFDMYGAASTGRGTAQRPDVSQATLESGRTDTFAPVETFSRSKLELARINASNGDRNAEAWLKEHGKAIYRAYEEGRIVD
jgi:hypothetical protein